jgi:hypothetical protein
MIVFQFVVLEGDSSGATQYVPLSIIYSVSKGSVLGSLLFLVYIDDLLLQDVQLKVRLFYYIYQQLVSTRN